MSAANGETLSTTEQKPVAWYWEDKSGCFHIVMDRPDVQDMAAEFFCEPRPLYPASNAYSRFFEHSVATLQSRVQPWMMACFGPEISADKLERADRLLEEVFELLQSGDYPRERIRALEEYTFSRERGEPAQEVGGVMITLAAYCLAHDLDMHQAGEVELSRIWTKVEKIRAKQAAKPTGSALPVAMPAFTARVQEVPVFGPFAHLNGVHGLSEEYWTVDSDPGTDDDELFCIPLYSFVDPFAAAPTAVPEIEVQDVCPICIKAFKVGDILRPRPNAPGPVHAECLENKPDVDQETGEAIRDSLPTFLYRENAPAPAPQEVGNND